MSNSKAVWLVPVAALILLSYFVPYVLLSDVDV